MEEVQPVTMSESSVLAPEEVFSKMRKEVKGESEVTREEKKRERKHSKAVQKRERTEKEVQKKQEPAKKLSKKDAFKQIRQRVSDFCSFVRSFTDSHWYYFDCFDRVLPSLAMATILPSKAPPDQLLSSNNWRRR
jgi:hypothetical protein